MEKGSDAWEKWMKELINPEDADEMGYGWKVNEIQWWEYSTVVFGANKYTRKNMKKMTLLMLFRKKLTILANKAMRKEVKNKKLFEFELAQLKQMIVELSEYDSSTKGAQNDSSEENAHEEKILTGFSSLIKKF